MLRSVLSTMYTVLEQVSSSLEAARSFPNSPFVPPCCEKASKSASLPYSSPERAATYRIEELLSRYTSLADNGEGVGLLRGNERGDERREDEEKQGAVEEAHPVGSALEGVAAVKEVLNEGEKEGRGEGGRKS